MILDKNLELSDQQAITASAFSTNIIDLGAEGSTGRGVAIAKRLGLEKIPFLVQVTEAFDNLTSLTIEVQTDTVEGFASPTTLHSETILLADLVAGRKLNYNILPTRIRERYLRLNYTVTGTAPTVGKVSAGIVADVDGSLGSDE